MTAAIDKRKQKKMESVLFVVLEDAGSKLLNTSVSALLELTHLTREVVHLPRLHLLAPPNMGNTSTVCLHVDTEHSSRAGDTGDGEH